MEPKTAILSYALGTGHRRVADVLSRELSLLGHACEHKPLESWVPWDYDLLFRDGYLLLALHLPAVWDAMYRGPFFYRRGVLALPLMRGRAIRRFGREGLPRFDLLVATQYNAMEVAADWRRRTGTGGRLAVVLTDYDVYPLWARPEVDLFLVPHAEHARRLVALGVDRERVRALGIPISAEFERAWDREATRASLCLDGGAPTALVLGGGGGFGPMRAAAEAALGAPSWQVVVVCGQNERLRRALVPLAQRHAKRLRVLGFRSDMPALMASCDAVVTKGGGLSLTEALYTGRRVIAIPGLPGQERANLEFVAARGWAEVCPRLEELPGLLTAGTPPPSTRPSLPPSPALRSAEALDALARGRRVPGQPPPI